MIPAFWNEHYKKYLGVNVTDDKSGCLQDVHGSHEALVIFQPIVWVVFMQQNFLKTATKQLPHLQNEILNGNTSALLNWLQKNIHQKGRFFTSENLCKEVTGETLNVSYFINYLLQKYGSIYNL